MALLRRIRGLFRQSGERDDWSRPASPVIHCSCGRNGTSGRAARPKSILIDKGYRPSGLPQTLLISAFTNRSGSRRADVIFSPRIVPISASNNQRNGIHVQVLVRDNNVDQALRALKKKMQREGIFREMKMRDYYEKPSQKRAREKAEAVRRVRKLARKRAQREGLIAAPRPSR